MTQYTASLVEVLLKHSAVLKTGRQSLQEASETPAEFLLMLTLQWVHGVLLTEFLYDRQAHNALPVLDALYQAARSHLLDVIAADIESSIQSRMDTP